MLDGAVEYLRDRAQQVRLGTLQRFASAEKTPACLYLGGAAYCNLVWQP